MASKEAKEAFVSGLGGTSMAEVVLVSLPTPVGLWLLGEARALAALLSPGRSHAGCGWKSFVTEYIALVAPVLLALSWTPLTGAMLLIMCTAAAVCAAAVLMLQIDALPSMSGAATTPRETKASIVRRWGAERTEALCGGRKAFVDDYRCGVMIITCVSILAVDFPAFPRRFAKTESQGTGLMDLGTGAVMFASGIVAARPRGSGKDQRGHEAYAPSFTKLMWSSWPMLLLGVGRFAAVKILGYQEHVSEYGVHWNFFVTIVGVRLLAAAMREVLPPAFRAPLALAAVAAYEVALSVGGLRTWLLGEGPRVGFVSQNREGICGLIGYTAIHLVAEDLARRAVWQPAPTKAATAVLFGRLTLLRLAAATALLWTAALVAVWGLGPPSRRATDLSYVLWCLGHNALLLLLVAAANAGASRPPGSILGARVSSFMFPVFAVANLATGTVNFAVNTLETPDTAARATLAAYMVVVCGAAWWMGRVRSGSSGSRKVKKNS